jgi:RNA polymerase sigma factor (sigma-70 family)
MKRIDTNNQLSDIVVGGQRRLRAIANCAGAHDRDDVVQDALVRVVASTRTQEISNPSHFLARVVKRVAIDRLRKRKSERATSFSVSEHVLVDPVSDPERGLAGAQRLRRALSVIESMPARRREVFLLHRVDELTYTQIARKLGVSTKVVEKHIHLALKQLFEADDQ